MPTAGLMMCPQAERDHRGRNVELRPSRRPAPTGAQLRGERWIPTLSPTIAALARRARSVAIALRSICE
jgi:hypothetical protein